MSSIERGFRQPSRVDELNEAESDSRLRAKSGRCSFLNTLTIGSSRSPLFLHAILGSYATSWSVMEWSLP